jgi:hypothetical protein
MSLSEQIKVATDELRMQMLGTQVLFGFQLRGTFQDGFDHLSDTAKIIDAIALTSIALSAAALIAAPAQHRIVERGNASGRLLRLTGNLGTTALVFLAITMGCDGFIVAEYYYGELAAAIAGAAAFIVALSAWSGVGLWLKRKYVTEADRPMCENTGLHEKIVQMLTEARVVLPGVQGIFGFQLVITMTTPFERLPGGVQMTHFIALGMMALSIILLIAPAAIHRLGFEGADSQRFQLLGSRIVSVALAPLMVGMTADFYVAVGKMLGYGTSAVVMSAVIFLVTLGAWYVWPWAVRSARWRQTGDNCTGCDHASQ